MDPSDEKQSKKSARAAWKTIIAYFRSVRGLKTLRFLYGNILEKKEKKPRNLSSHLFHTAHISRAPITIPEPVTAIQYRRKAEGDTVMSRVNIPVCSRVERVMLSIRVSNPRETYQILVMLLNKEIGWENEELHVFCATGAQASHEAEALCV